MTLSHILDVARKALSTTNVLLQIQNTDENDAESDRLYNALFHIRETLSSLIQLLHQPHGEAYLNPHAVLLEAYNSFLDANLTSLQGGLFGDRQRGNLTCLFKALRTRQQQSQTKAHILRFLETLVTDLRHHTQLLEKPYATRSDCDAPPHVTWPEHTAASARCHPQHHTHSHSRDSASRGRTLHQTDEGNQVRAIWFIEAAELEGDIAQLSEVPGSSVSANRRQTVNTSSSSPDLQPQILQTRLRRDKPRSHSPPPLTFNPPPPYESEVSPILNANSLLANLITPSCIEHSDGTRWSDPITLACRQIMAQEFPTPNPSVFDDYSIYRQRVRNRPNYRWYLNFHYLSFILQPEIPIEVFLVELNYRKIRHDSSRIQHTKVTHALLYLFEDCLVFGRSPFVDILPDPRIDWGRDPDGIPLILDSGIEVMEEFCLRFERVRRVERDAGKMLVVKEGWRDDSTIVTMGFWRKCQCRKVFGALRKGLARSGEEWQIGREMELPDDEVAHDRAIESRRLRSATNFCRSGVMLHEDSYEVAACKNRRRSRRGDKCALSSTY